MSAMSNYLENGLGDYLLRGQTFAQPSSVWIALFTTATTDAALGTEVSGGSYARVQITCALSSWVPTQGDESPLGVSTGTGGQFSNVSAVSFPDATADWGTVTHWAVCTSDGSPAGSFLFHGALTIAKTINSGDPVSFAAGSLTITFA